jgi:S-methylmethionine-dependent homocysteine/selenocysteine methylase
MELMLESPKDLSLTAFARLILRSEDLLNYVMSILHEVELILLIIECLRPNIFTVIILSWGIRLLDIFVSFVSWVPNLED